MRADINKPFDDKDKLEVATLEWESVSIGRPYLSPDCSKDDLEEEVTWLED